MHRSLLIGLMLVTVTTSLLAAPPDRDTKVRNDKANVLEKNFWIYDDLAKGIDVAKKSRKPLLVVIRCIPCEACEGFDARLVDRDPAVAELMDKFVCVRIVKGNGLDLAQFQFDYDLSFAAFFMNPDKTIYGRFGSRTKNVDPSSEITIEGFRKAMLTALEWHKEYPVNKAEFAAKTGGPVKFAVPEEYPSLKPRYKATLDYEGKVAQSCIHCHQIRDAHRRLMRESDQPLPDDVMYPYPMPDVVGLKLDPQELATVASVTEKSAAASAGFAKGDKIVALAGQPMLSIADVQWVLHNAKSPAKLAAVVERDGAQKELTLTLAKDWRKADDVSWRPTSWELRRMATGGLRLESIPAEELAKLDLDSDQLALRVKHVGQYNEHAAAKNAGFQQGDVIVEFDGSTSPLTETQLMALAMTEHRRGEKVPVKVRRAGKTVDLQLPLQ
jgi:serine protease Do